MNARACASFRGLFSVACGVSTVDALVSAVSVVAVVAVDTVVAAGPAGTVCTGCRACGCGVGCVALYDIIFRKSFGLAGTAGVAGAAVRIVCSAMVTP